MLWVYNNVSVQMHRFYGFSLTSVQYTFFKNAVTGLNSVAYAANFRVSI